ncbi:uncharacterized [Tachysurus ichikawai]
MWTWSQSLHRSVGVATVSTQRRGRGFSLCRHVGMVSLYTDMWAWAQPLHRHVGVVTAYTQTCGRGHSLYIDMWTWSHPLHRGVGVVTVCADMWAWLQSLHSHIGVVIASKTDVWAWSLSVQTWAWSQPLNRRVGVGIASTGTPESGYSFSNSTLRLGGRGQSFYRSMWVWLLYFIVFYSITSQT